MKPTYVPVEGERYPDRLTAEQSMINENRKQPSKRFVILMPDLDGMYQVAERIPHPDEGKIVT